MTQPNVPAQRALFVHAHPDDESLNNGATMAKYVAEGRGVTLVTCTAGEMGEVLVPELEHLAADREDRLARCPQGIEGVVHDVVADRCPAGGRKVGL